MNEVASIQYLEQTMASIPPAQNQSTVSSQQANNFGTMLSLDKSQT